MKIFTVTVQNQSCSGPATPASYLDEPVLGPYTGLIYKS